MIGDLDLSQRQVTIVGAGIAGLMLAYRLDQAGFEVTLYEREARVGGMISTEHAPQGLVERAAHSILVTPPVQRFFDELGVECFGVRPESRSRYIWRGGRMRRFPLHGGEALRALARAVFVLSEPRLRPEEQTLEDWTLRHVGRAALDYAISPMVSGIYAAHPSELSVAAAFPGLVIPRGDSLVSDRLGRKLRRRSRTATSARGQMMVPKYGMGAVVSALEARLRTRLGERFCLATDVRELPRTPNVILCTPPGVTAELLRSIDPASSGLLRQVTSAPLVAATVFVDPAIFATPPHGVGVLFPQRENRKILGVLFNSSTFEGRVQGDSRCSLTVMLGGTQNPSLLNRSDTEIKKIIFEELALTLGLKQLGDLEQRTEVYLCRWERAIPVYSPGICRVWRSLAQGWCAGPGRLVFGNWTGQVSIRGMIESVYATNLSQKASSLT